MAANARQKALPIGDPELFQLRLRQRLIAEIDRADALGVSTLSGRVSFGAGGGTTSLSDLVNALHAGSTESSAASIRILASFTLQFLNLFC